jgi:hypothetical protein
MVVKENLLRKQTTSLLISPMTMAAESLFGAILKPTFQKQEHRRLALLQKI